jgi:hypothetical protein
MSLLTIKMICKTMACAWPRGLCGDSAPRPRWRNCPQPQRVRSRDGPIARAAPTTRLTPSTRAATAALKRSHVHETVSEVCFKHRDELQLLVLAESLPRLHSRFHFLAHNRSPTRTATNFNQVIGFWPCDFSTSPTKNLMSFKWSLTNASHSASENRSHCALNLR